MASAVPQSDPATVEDLDPTVPAAVNVAAYGVEGRFADWAGDARYVEYGNPPIRSARDTPAGCGPDVQPGTVRGRPLADGAAGPVEPASDDLDHAPVAGPPSSTPPSGSARHQRPSLRNYYRTMGSTQC
jgi:hypothetical protein